MRNYCSQNNADFILPSNEPYFEKSFIVLNSIVSNIKDYDGIVFVSLMMLPPSEEKRREIFSKCLLLKKRLIFVIENLSVTCSADVEALENIYKLASLCSQNDDALEYFF